MPVSAQEPEGKSLVSRFRHSYRIARPRRNSLADLAIGALEAWHSSRLRQSRCKSMSGGCAVFGERNAFRQKWTMNLQAACADLYSIEEISGASVTTPAPPSDHIPLARRCAFQGHAGCPGISREGRRRDGDPYLSSPARHFLSSACGRDQALADLSRRAGPQGHNFNCAAGGRRLVSRLGRRPRPSGLPAS